METAKENMSRFPTSLLAAFAVALTLGAGCAKRSAVDAQGYIEGEYVYLASPLGGALTNLAVARGETVKAGQLLFTLERESEAAVVEQAEKNLAQAEAALNRSGAEFIRREQLSASGANVISAEELSRSQAQRDADAAQVASQKAALAKARWAYDQKQQVAPADAQVHDTLYRQGEYVAAASPVVSLLPPENLKVRFFVPQEKLPLVKVGETISVQPDGARQPFTATVNYISTQAEYTPPVIYSRETRANLVFMIEAKFSPADAAELRPGQPVDVRLP
jgi:HlyD family secretion protein